MEIYERLAHTMPNPENLSSWRMPSKRKIMDCITEKHAHLAFTNWAEEVGKFLIKFRRQILLHNPDKKIRINRENVPTKLENVIAEASKCIGWRLQFRKKELLIFPYQPNTQKSGNRMQFERNYQKALQKILVS